MHVHSLLEYIHALMHTFAAVMNSCTHAHTCTLAFAVLQEGDVVIMDVDPDGAIAVLAGDKKMRSVIDTTPAGIS